jgi:hypothetical protein
MISVFSVDKPEESPGLLLWQTTIPLKKMNVGDGIIYYSPKLEKRYAKGKLLKCWESIVPQLIVK